MNCHEDNQKKQPNHKHSPLKHMLHMILCCAIPIVILGLLPLITRFSPGAGNIVGRIAPFLCPLMMLSMIPMMMGGHDKKENHCDNTKEHHNRELKELNEPVK